MFRSLWFFQVFHLQQDARGRDQISRGSVRWRGQSVIEVMPTLLEAHPDQLQRAEADY